MTTQPANGVNRWVAYAAIVVAVVTVGGSIVTFFLQIGSLSNQVSAMQSEQGAQERRLDRLELDLEKLQLDEGTQEAALKEIETQFHAMDQLEDIRIAEELRFQCDVKQKLFSLQCEPYSFYPTIGKSAN